MTFVEIPGSKPGVQLLRPVAVEQNPEPVSQSSQPDFGGLGAMYEKLSGEAAQFRARSRKAEPHMRPAGGMALQKRIIHQTSVRINARANHGKRYK